MEKCLEEEEVKETIEDSESEESESEIASECDSAQSEEEEKEITQQEEECASPTVVFDVDAIDYLAVAQSVVDSLLDAISEQS